MPDNRTLSEKLASQISDPLAQISTIAKHIDEVESVNGEQINRDEIGVPDGVAPLNSSGKVPASYLPSGGGGGGASDWGDLGGTLSDQTDLQDALDLKANASALAGKENAGVAASTMAAHVGAADPHPLYALDTDLNAKENTGVAAGLVAALTKSSVGLGNVDNTSDANKPVSTAVTTALSGKENVGVAASAAASAVSTHNADSAAHGSLFSAKANTVHTHAQSDVTGLVTALGEKLDAASYDPSKLLDTNNGSIVAASGLTRRLYADNQGLSADWQNRALSDGIVGDTLRWADRQALDTNGEVTFDWQSLRLLSDGTDAINWAMRIAYGSDTSASIDWDGRHLQRSGAGTLSLAWETDTLYDAAEGLAANWTNGFKTNFGNSAARPIGLGTGDKGVMYFDTDELKQLWWDGTQWIDAAASAAEGNLEYVGIYDEGDAMHQYYPNQVVTRAGSLYRAKIEHHGGGPVPGGNVNWEPFYTLPTDGTFLGADGSPSTPTYGFASDGDQDTGMYWIADGKIGFSTNGILRMDVGYSTGLSVYGNIDGESFTSAAMPVEKFLSFQADGTMVALSEFAYDPVNFNGEVKSHNVVPTAAVETKNLHYSLVNLNPTVVDAHQDWRAQWLDVALGGDDSGKQLGDPLDVKSTLTVQDIKYTSRRYGTDGDVISIEYTGGATAGSEVVTAPSQYQFVIQIEDGVTTAQQVLNAINASNNVGDITGTVDRELVGSGSNAQVIAAETNLAGGVNRYGSTVGDAVNVYMRNKSNVGEIIGRQTFQDFGNGTDEVFGSDFRAYHGNTYIHDNAHVRGITVFEHTVGVGETNSSIDLDLRGIMLYGRVAKVSEGVMAFNAGFNLGEIKYANVFESTLAIEEIAQTINVFADFNNVSGTIGNQYYGLAIQPNLNEVQGGFTGVNISPNVNLASGNSNGLSVNMSGVTVYPGVKASVTVQDLHFEALQPGSGNNSLQIEYVNDGVAGSETVSIAGQTVTVHMESGDSTAQQIHDALVANISFISNVLCTITGSASNPQTAVAATNLAGGINPGTKRAGYFNGDVQIDGSLSFSGALTLGQLNAFSSNPLVNGGGAPASIHTLITQPTVGDNVTLTSADLLGINTAMLLSVGSNSTVGTSFLGLAALGLPAVASIGANSTVDRVAGALFAISLDAGAGAGGSIDQVSLCTALALPNGITAVDRLYGYEMRLPFGDIATDTWGVYIEPAVHNYMAGSLKIGPGGDIADGAFGLHVDGGLLVVANGDIVIDASAGGAKLYTGTQVSVDVALRQLYDPVGAKIIDWNAGLGFFGISPATQQSSSGAVTAGAVYTATEQTMIQQMYDAMRAYGLLN